MNAKLVLSSVMFVLLCQPAFANEGQGQAITKEQRQALNKECRAEAKQAEVAKDDMKAHMKECMSAKIKAAKQEG